MEGCFNGQQCLSLSAPASGETTKLEFKSELKHWFYSNLDPHGTPDFETTTTYEALEHGSLLLTRSVLRRPWYLKDIDVRTRVNNKWVTTRTAET